MLKKNKLFLSTLALILMISIMLVGCSGGGGASGDTIKIGALGPLTGEVASYGTATINGVNLAIEEINANGGIDGKQIEIVQYDTKGDKTETINIYNRLRDQDEVVAIIGGVISGETLAIKDLATSDNMPLITATSTALEATEKGSTVFRVCYTDPYQGAAAAKFSIETLGAKSVGILYNTDDAYSVGVTDVYAKAFEDAGLKVTNKLGYPKGEGDFSALLTQVQESNPDIIFLPDYYDKVGKITTQIRRMGLEQDVVGVDGWDSVEKDYAEQVEGYYFVNHFAKTDPDKVVQNFITGYQEKYNAEPNSFAALGYDTAYILTEAIKAAGSTDSQAILDKLAETEHKGVTGSIRFDEKGDVSQKDITIIQLKDGKHELLEKIVVK
ncbi:amino acid/amide ABC transporter substrate-binding protein (HAAT family) [Alkalibaculum bacchi]|uniref:Amino acid/amide ABC transporter substrate-binding protein (HAAT family) n=1 Tax=Alkalibaculum bacchi TaxID=645887 RepID=A0A366IEZ3_9FIRM|nr:amino acid/amide ABC transporter substrate-binding protein (HAAT family) [Alkalibaculum bacchi]